ncbi:kinase-like domain-containing protein [Tribonema minus]|uniref:Kinase-like domain-containing protein n=1 Tax=Tribonema minus TaxID=303371 RepID=A0A835ZEK4_9STRA|nr:kinase-like domain-containing protein [Tribonema minus]
MKPAGDKRSGINSQLGAFSCCTMAQEVWEEGQLAKDLRAKAGALLERKSKLDARRRFQELLVVEEEEAVRRHTAQLKKDEAAYAEERRALDARKARHMRELRRAACEDQRCVILEVEGPRGRYVLLNLLGKGGFSEVWRAYDVRGLGEVAVKIHQFDSNWSDARRTSFVRHATREYKIQKALRHERVVRLLDCFEITHSSFATVLELCNGGDLDELLKQNRCIPEKDARLILLQIVSGLRYVSSPHGDRAYMLIGLRYMSSPHGDRAAIIHYDLKPGNILFDVNGDVKITDFGLSKIVPDEGGGVGDMTSMELTSQGAGTLFYLPPETFVTGSNAPRISSRNKIDVWSLGVIFYQMLYGVRPFGEGQTQEAILREGTMLRATSVAFPAAGAAAAVSEEAKAFIIACLTHSQAERPDVQQLCDHPYLSRGAGR